MPLLVLASQAQVPNTVADVKRPLANFAPSIWGDHFLSYATMGGLVGGRHSLSPSLSEQVAHALNQPLRKSIPRVEARYYLSIYPKRDSHNETLLTFAKLDFNLLQHLHQKELCDITRWWKELDVRNNLPFVRDRVVECYFCWVLPVYFEPQYSFARRTLFKVSAMLSIIDDIYDSYGTLKELELFNQAIQRWDICAIDPLPNYMKVCYKALLEVYTEMEEEHAKEGKLYRIHYTIDAMKKQVKSYFLEAQWFHQNYVPTMDEYLGLSLMTGGCPLLIATSLQSPSKPQDGRLVNDIVSHRFEQKRGHVVSAVECYMKEFGATEEETTIELRRQVSDAWKDVNKSFLLPNAVSRPLLTRILNLACGTEVVYKYGDSYTTPQDMLKDLIASTLIQQVLV